MEAVFKGLLETIPHPIVFVNPDHQIIYINKQADELYHKELKRPNILGQPIFHCHNEKSKQKILAIVERFKNGGGEEYLKTNKRNEKIYVTPVRNDNNEFLGYYERFEPNGKGSFIDNIIK